MSKKQKHIEKLLNDDASFTWDELVSLLQRLGYEKRQGADSRVKFDNGDPSMRISLHRPHPGSELKKYARVQVIEKLKSGGLI